MAGGAHIVLIPEIPFHFEAIRRAIEAREAKGLHSTMVVVAEGARMPDGELVAKERRAGSEVRLGGIGEAVALKIAELTGKETRNCTLGHLQRGGSPTSLDRMLGTRFGVKAVKLIEEGKFGHMVSYQSYHVGSVPISDAVARPRLVDANSEIIETARSIGICFGDR
jgi:6-phosphofructokinase 1